VDRREHKTSPVRADTAGLHPSQRKQAARLGVLPVEGGIMTSQYFSVDGGEGKRAMSRSVCSSSPRPPSWLSRRDLGSVSFCCFICYFLAALYNLGTGLGRRAGSHNEQRVSSGQNRKVHVCRYVGLYLRNQRLNQKKDRRCTGCRHSGVVCAAPCQPMHPYNNPSLGSARLAIPAPHFPPLPAPSPPLPAPSPPPRTSYIICVQIYPLAYVCA